jgi:hypothetical protein
MKGAGKLQKTNITWSLGSVNIKRVARTSKHAITTKLIRNQGVQKLSRTEMKIDRIKLSLRTHSGSHNVEKSTKIVVVDYNNGDINNK